MIDTPFKLSYSELLCSAAATLCLQSLAAAGIRSRRLEDLCETPQYGYTASAVSAPTATRFLRITDIRAGAVDWGTVPFCECDRPASYYVASGDLLVARSGSVGKSFLVTDVPEPAVFASYMIRIRAKVDLVPEFASWCFRSQQFWEQLLRQRRGSAMLNINGTMLAALEFPLPARSLQLRIAEFLESFRRLLEGETVALRELPPPHDNVRRVVARIVRLASHIKEARSIRNQATEQAADLLAVSLAAMFSELRKDCPTATLGKLCDVVRGASPRPAGSALYYGGDTPFIKVGDLTRDDEKYLYAASASVNELGRAHSRFIGADTLMLTNSGATLGVPKITKLAGCFNDGSQAFLNLDPSIDKEYLFYFLKSQTPWFREQQARGQGQPNLNTEMTKRMDVPIPSLHEQHRTVAQLDSLKAEIDRLRGAQTEIAIELDALLPSILDRAFKGEL